MTTSWRLSREHLVCDNILQRTFVVIVQRVRAGGAVQADLPPHAAEGDGGGPQAHHGNTHPVEIDAHTVLGIQFKDKLLFYLNCFQRGLMAPAEMHRAINRASTKKVSISSFPPPDYCAARGSWLRTTRPRWSSWPARWGAASCCSPSP